MSLITILAWVCLSLAALPFVLIAWNLCVLKRLPPGSSHAHVSVLIPARNEAANIEAATASVLASTHRRLELLVLDDDSSDETATIVKRLAARDDRLRLVPGGRYDPALWGKPQACAELAAAASGDYLVFIDADVRLERDAIARIAAELDRSSSAMLSGVPWQQTETLGEKLIVPLIQFVLLGFLPLAAMRASPMPGFGVACGQLLAVRRDAYMDAGGHHEIADRIHDGLALARQMRLSGYMTDLADFTDLARCRMYDSARALIAGFAKNAHEGLGSPRGIVSWTVLLLGGQCAWVVLLFAASVGELQWLPVVVTGAVAWLARLLLDLRFRQPLTGTLLHPLGVFGLVAIQWYALIRRVVGRPVAWKQRVAQPKSEACGEMSSSAR